MDRQRWVVPWEKKMVLSNKEFISKYGNYKTDNVKLGA